MKKLPTINLDKRTNLVYVDSLINIGKQNLQATSLLKPSLLNDSLRLQAWAYLAEMYRYRAGKRDSVLYYSDKLMEQARAYKSAYYENQGIYNKVLYYQITKPNYPKALQLCHQAIKLIENYPSLKNQRWKYHIAMGEMFIGLEQPQKALVELKEALQHVELNRTQVPRYVFQYANILQQMGNCYKNLGKFEEAKKYLTDALNTIKATQSLTSLYYLHSDLGELYYDFNKYPEALQHFSEAEEACTKINNRVQILYTWSWLAQVYTKLNNADKAIEYGQKSLGKGAIYLAERQSHYALYQAYQNKENWQQALYHYKQYQRVTDTLLVRRKLNESVNIQNQFELDQLVLRSQQAQEIQAQKLIAIQKQAEIEKLQAKSITDKLIAQNKQAALQSKLTAETLKTNAIKIQQRQQTQIKELKIKELNQQVALQNQMRNFLAMGIGLLLLTGIILLINSYQLKQKNIELKEKNEEITAALLKGQTTERKRVAAELHDNLGGLLGAIKMTTNTIDKNHLPLEEQTVYTQIVEMIDDAHQQLRKLAHNLLPDQLEKQGLLPSLHTLVSKLNKGGKTTFSLHADGIEGYLDKKVAFNIYTIVLEACNNIIKHAQATEASIEILKEAHFVKLIISDNGVGFDSQQNLQTDGVGFSNIQERAKAINAFLSIYSKQGEGTVLSLKINLLNDGVRQT